jgi:hypothetical protein
VNAHPEGACAWQNRTMEHLDTAQLEAGIDEVRAAPSTEGTLELIVRRPVVDGREVLETGELTLEEGLVGDSWLTRHGEEPDPDTQLNIMNARFTALIAGSADRWQLAGDQLYLDLDIGEENLPVGTRVAIGDAVIEVTAVPHTGCQKFSARFGLEARRFVNSEVGKALRLRGLNARVVTPGTVRRGDPVRKLG